MRKIFFLLTVLFTSTHLFTQRNISKFPGFIVTNTNDTVKVQILITDHVNNIELSNLFNVVYYFDSAGNKFTAFPDEKIACFQFTKNSKNYLFEKILVNEKRNRFGFALRLINGPVTLYQYCRETDLDSFRPTLNPNQSSGGTYTQRYIYYYLKRGNTLSYVRTKATLKNIPGSIDKKWLRDYFSDNAELANKIGKEIEEYDLESIVNEYNLKTKQN